MERDKVRTLVVNAQNSKESAIEELLKLFEPLLKSKSMINGQFDEDVFQELSIKFIECTKKFKICYNMDIVQMLKE